MKLTHSFRLVALSAVMVIANSAVTPAAFAADYSFRVHNTTQDRITKILVSENRRSWGQFNIGRGIQPGKSAKLVWDKSTNNEACEQWVKAVFDDGSETKPAKFDFCESDLEIEF